MAANTHPSANGHDLPAIVPPASTPTGSDPELDPLEAQTRVVRAAETLSGRTIAIISGGRINRDLRSTIDSGTRPRLDILEMEHAYGARVVDIDQMEEAAQQVRGGFLRPYLIRHLPTGTLQRGLAALALVADCDAVYATGEDVGYPLAAAMRLYNHTRTRLVVYTHDVGRGRTRARRAAYNAFAALARGRIDCPMFCTPALARVVTRAPQLRTRTSGAGRVILEKTDERFFAPDSWTAADDGEADLPGTRPFILSAGLEGRDYTTLVKAARRLSCDVVITAFSPWANTVPTGLQPRALPANIRVGAVSSRGLRARYHHAAAVAVPLYPTVRGCGVTVLLEAASMGLPVVATRTGGLAPYIDAGLGQGVRPGDATEMRAALQGLLDHPSDARTRGQHARDAFFAHHTMAHFVAAAGEAIADAIVT